MTAKKSAEDKKLLKAGIRLLVKAIRFLRRKRGD